MTVVRALASSSNSLGPDRRESATLQELHRYCPNFAMRLGGTSQSFNLGLMGLSLEMEFSGQW